MDVAVHMAINVQPQVQRHRCPTVHVRVHGADNGFLDSLRQGCQAGREKQSRRGRNAAVKTSFALCSMQGGKKKKSGGDTKMVMTVKAFSHTLAGGSGKRRARQRDRERERETEKKKTTNFDISGNPVSRR